MSWPGQTLLQFLVETLGLPVGFLGVLLTVLLALTLAPFLGGLKAGIEIPKLPTRWRRGLIVGSLLTWVVLLLPVIPTEIPPKTTEGEDGCLRTAEIDRLIDVEGPEPTTLSLQLENFEWLMAAHDLPIHVTYDDPVEVRDLHERTFPLFRTAEVPKPGCWILSEIARALNRSVSSEEDKIKIFASCDEVFVALQGTDPPEGDFEECS